MGPRHKDETGGAQDVALLSIVPRGAQSEHEVRRSQLHQLFLAHGRFVRSLVARLAGPGIDPKDLSQEVFLTAWRRLPALRPDASPRAFLASIAVKVAAGARRRARVHRFLGLDDDLHPADPQTPESIFAQAEASRRVYAALTHLSDKKRTVFVLYELQGLTGEEIAQAVGCPLKTVWSRLAHARREFEQHVVRPPPAPHAREGQG